MKSKRPMDLLDLEHDLPTTKADIAALRKARGAAKLSLQDYLAFLSRFPTVRAKPIRARKHPVKMFEL